GWMSPEYIEAIQANDRAIGKLLSALGAAGLRESYTYLIQADHGGHGADHGTDSPEDMTIPPILKRRSVKQGHAIQSPVNMADTPATIAHILGVERPAVWEGSPIHEAFI